MNRLLENGDLIEMNCGTNFAYLIDDNNMFLSTEYKVLQSQANSYFVKCMKMLYNGKTQLFYLTKALRPLSLMFSSLDSDSFLTIVSNLLADILDVRQNGFLSCQSIDMSFDKIFVDPSTYKVSLIYVPVHKRIFDDSSTFENELRTRLIRVISDVSNLSSPKTTQFAVDLSNGLLSLEDLSLRVKGGKEYAGKKDEHKQNSKVVGLCIVAMNSPNRVEIPITKDSFLIGKNASAVDGVISFNKMISRIHCKIERHGANYTITDLQSANGTYVNRARLVPNQPYPIKVGDVIRLANSDFQVGTV